MSRFRLKKLLLKGQIIQFFQNFTVQIFVVRRLYIYIITAQFSSGQNGNVFVCWRFDKILLDGAQFDDRDKKAEKIYDKHIKHFFTYKNAGKYQLSAFDI